MACSSATPLPPPGMMIAFRFVIIDLVHMLTDPTRLFLCRGLVAFVLQKRSIATHFVDESRRRGKKEKGKKERNTKKWLPVISVCLLFFVCWKIVRPRQTLRLPSAIIRFIHVAVFVQFSVQKPMAHTVPIEKSWKWVGTCHVCCVVVATFRSKQRACCALVASLDIENNHDGNS